jgi:hypothetical protein
MNRHFPDAEITGYEQLVDSMTNDLKDRHVLATAVRGGAELLVTETTCWPSKHGRQGENRYADQHNETDVPSD